MSNLTRDEDQRELEQLRNDLVEALDHVDNMERGQADMMIENYVLKQTIQQLINKYEHPNSGSN